MQNRFWYKSFLTWNIGIILQTSIILCHCLTIRYCLILIDIGDFIYIHYTNLKEIDIGRNATDLHFAKVFSFIYWFNLHNVFHFYWMHCLVYESILKDSYFPRSALLKWTFLFMFILKNNPLTFGSFQIKYSFIRWTFIEIRNAFIVIKLLRWER